MNRKRWLNVDIIDQTINHFLAPYIFGPPEQSALNTSSAVIYQLISGQLPEEGLPLFVDVRDVAQAHVLALKNKSVIGKRVLLSGGPFTFYEVRRPRGISSRTYC